MADPKIAHPYMCYQAEFGCSALEGIGINTGEFPKLSTAGTSLSWDGRLG